MRSHVGAMAATHDPMAWAIRPLRSGRVSELHAHEAEGVHDDGILGMAFPERFKDGREQHYAHAGRFLLGDTPLVVLIDGGSASASGAPSRVHSARNSGNPLVEISLVQSLAVFMP